MKEETRVLTAIKIPKPMVYGSCSINCPLYRNKNMDDTDEWCSFNLHRHIKKKPFMIYPGKDCPWFDETEKGERFLDPK